MLKKCIKFLLNAEKTYPFSLEKAEKRYIFIQKLLNFYPSTFFTPFILQPTRLHSKTLIDNIFFNSLEYQSVSGNLLIEISDHLIQFLI